MLKPTCILQYVHASESGSAQPIPCLSEVIINLNILEVIIGLNMPQNAILMETTEKIGFMD